MTSTAPAQVGSVATIGGDLTYVWRMGDTGPVVLASGWTDAEELLALIHPDLRPDSLTEAPSAQIAAAVSGWANGDLDALQTVAVEQHSGPFTTAAWRALREVHGTITYTEFAARSGNPRAVRAAAAACANNAAALFVPCHRVLRSDGSLGGFRYGLSLKQELIAHES